MSYFVTGTDTGVGKTLVSCALLHAFAARGRSVVGMKPVAAGCDDDMHEDVRQLRAASNMLAGLGQINPYSFVRPVAPHLAARFAGIRISLDRILEAYSELNAQADVVIVEGAGGFRVPLNDEQDSADMVQQMNIPVVLVVGMRLGCLNHALLTAEAIAVRGLTLAGWVANVVDPEMAMLDENVAALEQRIAAPLLGIVPHQAQPDALAVAALLDTDLLEPGA
ncbi:MAG: dethiobiotin synthase [Gallionella sp.]|jgi:dethiobiotin synthetase|nr:dethiobiotin synthase [Gallionella sp.]MCK9354258.1 dethiobiotin synthase [Gallionella sp.]